MRDDILQPSFADLELMRQGIEMDPVLAQVSAYVDQHVELIQAVEQRLEDGLKKPKTGRRGLTGAQVLLSWILMRIKNWDYRELAERDLRWELRCEYLRVSTATRFLAIRHFTAGIAV
jgi:IS5 family transposase